MKKSITAIVILWSILGILIIGVIAGGIYLSTNNRSITSLFNGNKKEELLLDETYSMVGIQDLSLDLASDEVIILPASDDQLRVKHYGTNTENNNNLQVTATGTQININRPFRISFFTFSFFDKSRIEVYLPEAYQENMSLGLSSGSIAFEKDLELNHLKVDLTSGNINGNKNLAAKTANIHLTSGAINFNQLNTETYTIDMTSGNLGVGEMKGSGSIKSTSGSVTINGLDITDSLDIDITSGDIRIGLVGNPSIDFTGEKTSGTINTYFEILRKGDDDDKYFAKVGDAPYKTINVDVTSGLIEITQK